MDIRIYEACEMWSETCLKSWAQLIQLNVCVCARGESIRLVSSIINRFFFIHRNLKLNWSDDKRKLCIAKAMQRNLCSLLPIKQQLKWAVHWTEVHWFRIIFYPLIAHTRTHAHMKKWMCKNQLETNRKIHTRNLNIFFCMWCDRSTHWTATDMKRPPTDEKKLEVCVVCE